MGPHPRGQQPRGYTLAEDVIEVGQLESHWPVWSGIVLG